MWMRRVIFFFVCRVIFFFCVLRTSTARGAGGGALPDFFFFFFPCSADHERDWPPCKVVFFGLATNALNVRNKLTRSFLLNSKNNDTVPLCLKIREAKDGNGTGDIWGTTVRNKRVFVIGQEFWHYFLFFYRTESDNSRPRRTPKNHTLILLGTPFHVSTLFFQLMDQPTRY